ncbi:hypothetical protein GOBAR_DD03955 [Gossypium barbadense]|nr:hypothetical protein GOBAR_DD03955 [Gossypium barbadense]
MRSPICWMKVSNRASVRFKRCSMVMEGTKRKDEGVPRNNPIESRQQASNGSAWQEIWLYVVSTLSVNNTEASIALKSAGNVHKLFSYIHSRPVGSALGEQRSVVIVTPRCAVACETIVGVGVRVGLWLGGDGGDCGCEAIGEGDGGGKEICKGGGEVEWKGVSGREGEGLHGGEGEEAGSALCGGEEDGECSTSPRSTYWGAENRRRWLLMVNEGVTMVGLLILTIVVQKSMVGVGERANDGLRDFWVKMRGKIKV